MDSRLGDGSVHAAPVPGALVRAARSALARAINVWLGDGFYYRLLDSAQRRNTAEFSVSLAFTRFVGDLVEEWAVRLVKSAHPGDRRAAPDASTESSSTTGTKLSPDVAIDLGTDLVLIEVRSGYLTRELRVGGDVRSISPRPRPAGASQSSPALRPDRRPLSGTMVGPRESRRLTSRACGRSSSPHDITQTEPLRELIECSLPRSTRTLASKACSSSISRISSS